MGPQCAERPFSFLLKSLFVWLGKMCINAAKLDLGLLFPNFPFSFSVFSLNNVNMHEVYENEKTETSNKPLNGT